MAWQDTLEDWGWGIRTILGEGGTLVGPGEVMPPEDLSLREVHDYSGTASLNEVSCVLTDPNSTFHKYRVIKNNENFATKPAFDLGKFVRISGGRVGTDVNVFLQERSLYKNIAIIGPSSSGKTAGFIIPGIKNAIDIGLSNVVIDVKGGQAVNGRTDTPLIDALGPYAEQKGFRVVYWSAYPNQISRSHSINLLDNVYSIQEAQILAKALYGTIEDLEQNRQYAQRDINWISEWIILIKSALGDTASLKHVYEIAQNPVEKLSFYLERCEEPEIRNFISAQLALMQNDPERSPIAFTWAIQSAINPFAWPNYEQVMGHSDIILNDIQNQPTLLIVAAELAGRDVSAKISAALIDFLMTLVYRRWTDNTNGLGIIFWLDEFPRIQDRINLAEFTSVSRSAKGGVVIASQSFEQITERNREEILESIDTVIFCRNVGYRAATWFNNRLGATRSQSVRRRRYFESSSLDEYAWFRTRSARQRYENRREDVPVLRHAEIQYPIGGTYVATVQARDACAKPFLVDYQRVIEPASSWQPLRSRSNRRNNTSGGQNSLNWQNSRFVQETAISHSAGLSWQDPNNHQACNNSPMYSLNWRDGESTNESTIPNSRESNVSQLNWQDIELDIHQ